MKAGDRSTALQFRIPPGIDLHTFDIIPSGATNDKGSIPATNVEFSGTSVRFRATLRGEADCKLDAIPALGYKGVCRLATGDSVDLALVPPTPGMLLAEHEVRIARDAAPPAIQTDASIFVFEPSGYTEAVHGTNGFACFIERPTANDAWPMCHNREAADALLPVEQYRVGLRRNGVGDSAIRDSVVAGYRSGRFHAPATGALGYMLSRSAWTLDTETHVQTFLGPHLHIYAPNVTNAGIGVDITKRPVVAMRVEREGTPDASIIVGVKLIDPAGSHP